MTTVLRVKLTHRFSPTKIQQWKVKFPATDYNKDCNVGLVDFSAKTMYNVITTRKGEYSMPILLSENLRVMRVKERYSMEDIAEIIGVSRQAVAKWESGETLPDIEKCVKLAKLYKVSLDALVNAPLRMTQENNGEDGKYSFGITKVAEGGTVTIPREALNLFGIEDGDTVLVLCDEKKGMALVKCDNVY